MNLHKLLCFLNHHDWYYWTDKSTARFGYETNMRDCTVCNKKQRKYRDTWLKLHLKLKSLSQIRKEQKL